LQVIPPELRGTAFGTITMIQTLFAFLATTFVTFVADNAFNMNEEVVQQPVSSWPDDIRKHNVSAMGNALLFVDILALSISVITYLFLQNTYPSDRDHLLEVLRNRDGDDEAADDGDEARLLMDEHAE
jgi:hypothetical protein